MNEWMSCTHFSSSYKSMCQMCFQCMIVVCESYELQMNKVSMISIVKLWDVKFVMSLHLNICQRKEWIIFKNILESMHEHSFFNIILDLSFDHHVWLRSYAGLSSGVWFLAHLVILWLMVFFDAYVVNP